MFRIKVLGFETVWGAAVRNGFWGEVSGSARQAGKETT